MALPLRRHTLRYANESQSRSTLKPVADNIQAIDLTTSTEASSSEISSSSEEYIPSSTSEEPVFVPQPTDPDVPAVALASPNNIIGDIYGSPSSYDDVSLPVSSMHCLANGASLIITGLPSIPSHLVRAVQLKRPSQHQRRKSHH